MAAGRGKPWFRCYAIAEPDALVKTFVFEVAY